MAINRATTTVSTSVGGNTTSLTGNAKYLRAVNLTGAGYVSFTLDGSVPTLGIAESYAIAKTPGATTCVRLPQTTKDLTITHIADVSTIAYFELTDDECCL